MTIQPIVENSLSHGLNSQTEEGEIIIKGGLTPEKDILIEISDNGVGIDKNLLALLNNSDIMSEKLGIGIRNTNNRLKHYFGSKYGLKIKSKLNIGTKVEIRIPRIKA
jgi:sensor histidine kinase YesM